jgi:hypothetical protein
LQPAVSHQCFAIKTPDGLAGGYSHVPGLVESPILATYSSQDVPLRRLFHLAVRRDADKAEARVAAEEGAPPSRFAALGGYGPRYSREELIEVLLPPVPYEDVRTAPIYGLNGSNAITGHGDVTNQYTWWALYVLLQACL